MNCQRANSLLSAFLDRELSAEERRQLRLHLMICGECEEEVHDLELVKGILGGLNAPVVPPVILWLRAELAAHEADQELAPFVWQQPWFRRTCAAAALLLLFGLSSWLLLPRWPNQPGQANPLSSIPTGSWVDLRRTR